MPDFLANDSILMPNIDFCFLGKLDNNDFRRGFVAKQSTPIPYTVFGHSVTLSSAAYVAGILNLSASNVFDLRKLYINPTLIGKLYPYLGLTGLEAHQYLMHHPLKLSEHETNAILLRLYRKQVFKLIMHYDKASNLSFCLLPPYWQTIIVSLELCYGGVQDHFPGFWLMMVSQNWAQAMNCLSTLHSGNRQRHEQEANYLQVSSSQLSFG